MLKNLKAFFDSQFSTPARQPLSSSQLHLACAALMIEVAVIDEHFGEDEAAVLLDQLRHLFADLAPATLARLLELARTEQKQATSLYQFTRLVNDHCSRDDKFALLQAMWTVARADGRIDKYEDYMIRKVSELLYLTHSEFIRAKHLSAS